MGFPSMTGSVFIFHQMEGNYIGENPVVLGPSSPRALHSWGLVILGPNGPKVH